MYLELKGLEESRLELGFDESCLELEDFGSEFWTAIFF